MSILPYFYPIAERLLKSGYATRQQIQKGIIQFQESGLSITEFNKALVEILESMTGYPMPNPVKQSLIIWSDFSPFARFSIQSGYISEVQMQQVLAETRKSRKPLTDALELITGHPVPANLLRQYKKQQLFKLKILYGVESIDLELVEVSNDPMSELIDTLISTDICRRYRLLPLSKTETQPPVILVAMVDPDNLDAIDDLERILRPQRINLRRMVITYEDYQQLLSRYLNQQLACQKQIEAEKSVDFKEDLESLDTLFDALDEGEATLDTIPNNSTRASIINLVNKIMSQALQEGASDIHVEPQAEYLRVRFRKDGVLHEAFEPLPKKITPAVSSRFKIMAQLNIYERRVPHYGKIRRMFQGRQVDFLVSTLPSRYGEKVVLQILDNESTQLGLDKLITDPNTLQMVREMASRPFGLILVTGPTGSGKLTTLYSVLAECNNPGVNISTAENPIEYSLPGITQVQVLREKGLDFASILRSFLRQDPDVILVGEIPDSETARIVVQSALNGCLVLSSLPVHDAVGAINRLLKMGIEPFLLSNALLGVIAQRLVRRVCPNCRISYTPTAIELAKLGWSSATDEPVNIYKAKTLKPKEIIEAKTKLTICHACQGIGYKGQIGVFEVMRVSDRIQTLINESASTQQIEKAAIDEGMTTLLAYSLNLVKQGYTTLDEVERLIFSTPSLEVEHNAKHQRHLSHQSVPNTEAEPQPTELRHRLRELEKQLEILTAQVQQLKKDMEN